MLEIHEAEATETPTTCADLVVAEPVEVAAIEPDPASGDDSPPVDVADAPPPAPPSEIDEGDVEDRLICAVMPATFDAMDEVERHLDSRLPQPERLNTATGHARALLVQRGIEPGSDQLERLATLIGKGVCDHDEEGADDAPDAPIAQARPEPEKEATPQPPTPAELAVAVRLGREQITQAMTALATATPDEGAAILARIEQLRESVAELESLLPDGPAFPADAKPEPMRSIRVDAPAAPRRPSLVVPAMMLGAGVLLQVGAFAVVAMRGRSGHEGENR